MTIKLVRRTRHLCYVWFAPLSFFRAFARGFGLSLGVLGAGRSPPQAARPEPRLHPPAMVGDKMPT
jgi:hypothetical protein